MDYHIFSKMFSTIDYQYFGNVINTKSMEKHWLGFSFVNEQQNTIKSHMHKELITLVSFKSFPLSHIFIFDLITSLKRTCPVINSRRRYGNISNTNSSIIM